MSTWPAHTPEPRPWRQATRGGTIDDRKLSTVVTMLPPVIAGQSLTVSSDLSAAAEAAVIEISALDHAHGPDLTALATLLLRTESVASSKIEHISASTDDFARALHGIRSNPAAVSMAASADALAALINSVDGGGEISLEVVLRAHRALMSDDPHEQPYAGRVRDMQNWIGGSDYSPRNALFVPPPPDTVPDYLADLIGFANRTDLPALVQAAVVHAQFESIHPFTDGNGRIGRALINTVFRRRGVTNRVIVPLASALVARRDEYFELLGRYRIGEVEPIIAAFTRASSIAASESRLTATRIADMPTQWREAAGVRAGSAAARLIEVLPTTPIFGAEDVARLLGGATSSVYGAIERLEAAGIVRPLTTRKRGQVWGVVALLDELDDLGTRIAAAALTG
jgi:Fic family protein